MQVRKWRFGLVIALMLALLPSLSAFGQDAYKIKINSVPKDPPGEAMASDQITGIVTGGDTNQYTQFKVVIYARGGEVWWVQPTVASPLTDVASDGTWNSDTHGGEDFAALLVKPTFQPDAKLDAIPKVKGDIIAVTKWKSQH